MEQLRDVSNILWRERNLLELLAFKLDSERLLARAGRTRWLARADHEVEMVLGELKAVELERGIQVQALVDELGLGTEPTLQAFADRVPTEWAGIFADHRRALLELARDVDRSARRSRRRTGPPGAVVNSVPADERGDSPSRALADIVTPASEQTAAEARALALTRRAGILVRRAAPMPSSRVFRRSSTFFVSFVATTHVSASRLPGTTRRDQVRAETRSVVHSRSGRGRSPCSCSHVARIRAS